MKYRKIRDALIYLLIFGCILAVVISQIYLTVLTDSQTEDAVLFTTRESLSFTGVIVRDEALVYTSYTGEGILNYSVDDGSRLSKKSSIASIYKSYDQIYNRYKIDLLKAEREVLQKAQDRGTTDYAQPEFISSQISEQYKAILSDIKTMDYSDINSKKLNLLKLMCILNVSSNVESDYSARIESLSQKIKELEMSLVAPEAVISANESGYFTSVIDGYESDINIDKIENATPEKINEIIANPVKEGAHNSNAIGKVFSDYTWKMVGVINTDDRYFVNREFQLILTSLGRTYTARVESITPTGNGNEAVIVLSCDEMDATIAASRVADVEILFGDYTGIRVPRSAIRFIDGIKGVYIKEGEKMLFKPLDVIYEGDDYVLSNQNADNGFLQLYDRVLLDPVPTENEVLGSSADSDNKRES